jgi:pimeloyl-ACP methyl ester carboxylesterase
MPFASAQDGTQLYYEVYPANGKDPHWPVSSDRTPLLMIMGLGLNSLSWYKNLPGLSSSRTVIVFDNRGTGRSDKPDRAYSIKQMAADAVAVLDAAKVRRAHVFGYSMGSMIAQEVALNYPHRTKSLILGASTCGGLQHHAARPQVALIMAQRGFVQWKQASEMIIPILYSREFIKNHPEEIEADTRVRLVYPTPAYAYRHQLAAIARHSTYNRLDQLHMPALVFTGDNDLMVVPQNSQVLARRIPRAELMIAPGHGHYLPSEDPALTNRFILEFLDRHFARTESYSRSL